MLGIHPKKYWKKQKEAYQMWRFKRQAAACGVDVQMGVGVRLKKCSIYRGMDTSSFTNAHTSAKSELEIGDYSDLKYTVFMYYGMNNAIRIGEGTQVNAFCKGDETRMQVSEGSKIEVGEDCLLSNSILVSTTDFHQICNMNGEKVNKDKDVRIGKHVWIGQKAYIGKGVEIGDDIVVGGFSVVTKSFKQGHCVVAGNPATIKKENIDWSK